MKLATLKAALIAIVVAVAAVVGVTVVSRLEKSMQAAPEGAGTRSALVQTSGEDLADEAPEVTPAVPAATPVPDDTFVMTVDDKKYMLNPDLSTLLVLGTDDIEADEDEGSFVYSQADFIVLAIFNDEAKTCTLLQIDRNTMTDVTILDEHDQPTGTALEQICLAHDYGSSPEIRCENTVRAVTDLLYGIPIDNYASLAMGGITALNDAVGGVTVTIEDDFTGVDDTLVQGETVTLMGEHAYNFVHARYSMQDDANTARMRRQRMYMSALTEKLREKVKEDSGFAITVFGAIADYLVTDCEVDELSGYSEGLADYTLSDIVVPEGEVIITDYQEFHPDEDALLQTVIDLLLVPVEEEAAGAESTVS